MSTPPDPTPVSSGAPSPATTPAAPPHRSGALLAVAAIVVVAVVVLAALLLAGVGPFARHSGTSAAVTFSSARQTANSTASSHGGGFTTLVFGAGFSSRSTLTLPVLGLLGNPGCTIAGESSTNTTTVPSTAVGAGTGSAAFWAFLYRNSSGAGLLVSVTNGAASVVGTLDRGQNCAFLGNQLGAIPSGVIDSVAAVNAANHEGGTGFLSAHPNATGVYAVLGGSTALTPGAGAEWLVDYSLCTPFSTSGAVEPQFTAVLNGLSGEVLAADSTNTTCSGAGNMSSSLGSEFAFGPPSQIANGTGVPACAAAGASDWCDSIPIESVGGGLHADELAFLVETSVGTPVVFSGAAALPMVAVESLTGSIVAEFSLATSSWVLGSTLLLSTTQTLILDLGCTVSGSHSCNPTPTGLVLVAEGVGAVSGSVSTTLI
jgi:hypothetical protein